MLAAFGAATLTGCTTTRTLSVSQENKTTRVSGEVNGDGKPWLLSVKKNTVLVCLLTPECSIRLGDLHPPVFLVVVRNGGDQWISLSCDNVTATIHGRPVHLLTHEEYLAAIRDQEVWEWARARSAEKGPLGGVEADAVMPQYTPGGGGASSYAPPPVTTAFFVPTSAPAIAKTPDDALLDSDLMPVLGQFSIAPGETVRGVVRFKPSDLSRGQRLRILVRAGDETHEFVYDIGH